MSEHVINIDLGGRMSFIASDELVSLKAAGQSTTRRASHVEPDENDQWTADLSPVGGPMLGPFALRSEALKAEHDWLLANVFEAEGPPANNQ